MIIGPVTLTVNNVTRVGNFYMNILGFSRLEETPGRWVLGAGETPLLVLLEDSAAPRNTRWPGLYHVAYLLPDRYALARIFYQLVERQYPIQGAADHGVSEAIYLADPEKNGIELYCDRQREEWPIDEEGQIAMGTDELNLEHLLFELRGSLTGWQGIDPRTVVGHIHLQVSDIPAAVDFYTRVLGLELQQRYGNQAAFLSRDGYHHHIGINTWQSLNMPAAPQGAAGLQEFGLTLPSSDIKEILSRADTAGLRQEDSPQGLVLQDPSGNRVLLQQIP